MRVRLRLELRIWKWPVPLERKSKGEGLVVAVDLGDQGLAHGVPTFLVIEMCPQLYCRIIPLRCGINMQQGPDVTESEAKGQNECGVVACCEMLNVEPG